MGRAFPKIVWIKPKLSPPPLTLSHEIPLLLLYFDVIDIF